MFLLRDELGWLIENEILGIFCVGLFDGRLFAAVPDKQSPIGNAIARRKCPREMRSCRIFLNEKVDGRSVTCKVSVSAGLQLFKTVNDDHLHK